MPCLCSHGGWAGAGTTHPQMAEVLEVQSQGMAGSPFATLKLLPPGSVHVDVSPCPMGAGPSPQGALVPSHATKLAHPLMPGLALDTSKQPRLSRGLSEEEQTEGPASCRGKETEQRGWHFLRSAPAPAPGSALCGSSRGHDIDSGEWPGEQLNVLIILSRAPKGLFPTPAFPKDVPMIKTQRTWVCGDHIGSRLKMRKLEGRCAFSKLPSD